MPFSLYRGPDGQPQSSAVEGARLRIGRGADADLRLDDRALELAHAEIVETPSGYLLHDLGGVIGTRHNGVRTRAVVLGDGDTIEVGAYRLRVQVPEAGGPLVVQVDRPEVPATADEATRPLPAPTADASAAPAIEVAPAVDVAPVRPFHRDALRPGVVAATVLAIAAGVIYALRFERARQRISSPGALAEPHRAAIPADGCNACHGARDQVLDASCTSAGCHPGIGDHNAAVQASAPVCIDCHTEHQGLGPLRLSAAEDLCVGCHRALPLASGVTPRFADGIRGFADGHPEFAVEVAGERRRLDTEPRGTTRLRFTHANHLRASRARLAEQVFGWPFSCQTCHGVDKDGEIAKVDFEDSCRGCHNLLVDARLPGNAAMAPHAEPATVLSELSARYRTFATEVAGRLGAEERRIFQRGDLSRPDKLSEVSRQRTAVLLQQTCTKCHPLNPPWPSTADEIRATTVTPPNIEWRFLGHARFRHRPHLSRGIPCGQCHTGAAESNDSGEILVPRIAACRECHRSSIATDATATHVLLASDRCELCHAYHPRGRRGSPSPQVAVAR